MVKIAFIEDDHFYLQSLKSAVHMQPDMVCQIASLSAEDFWNKLPERASLDVVFIDIDLPGQSGVEALPKLRRRFPKAELVMLTNNEDRQQLLRSFASGATGYLLKDFPIGHLPRYISTLTSGGALISPQMARWVVQFFYPAKSDHSQLTEKELQLLRLFSKGQSYKECAAILDITVDGIKYHVKSIYRKLNVSNRIAALRAVDDHI